MPAGLHGILHQQGDAQSDLPGGSGRRERAAYAGKQFQDEDSFLMLPRSDRMTILKLTAILRIADAMDRGHIQKFTDFSIKIMQNTMYLQTKKSKNTVLEKIAMSEKSGMFESIFGYMSLS